MLIVLAALGVCIFSMLLAVLIARGDDRVYEYKLTRLPYCAGMIVGDTRPGLGWEVHSAFNATNSLDVHVLWKRPAR